MIHFLVGLNIEIVITIDERELNICPSKKTYHWLNLNIVYIYNYIYIYDSEILAES